MNLNKRREAIFLECVEQRVAPKQEMKDQWKYQTVSISFVSCQPLSI